MEGKCFTCETTLVAKDGEEGENGKHECPTCKEIYWACVNCIKTDEPIFDWYGNIKGMNCKECDGYFCIFCWQNSGALGSTLMEEIFPDRFPDLDLDDEDIDDDDYVCEECLSGFLKDIEDRE